MPSTHSQRTAALALANDKRIALAALKRQIADGTLTLADICAQRPAPLAPLPLIDVLRLLPRFGRAQRRGGTMHLEAIGREAAKDGINLCVTLERASQATLDWLRGRVDAPMCKPKPKPRVKHRADPGLLGSARAAGLDVKRGRRAGRLEVQAVTPFHDRRVALHDLEDIAFLAHELNTAAA